MKELCEYCQKEPFTQLCDFAERSGIITSQPHIQELSQTCDIKLCRHCAVNIWHDSDLCPTHAQVVYKRIKQVYQG